MLDDGCNNSCDDTDYDAHEYLSQYCERNFDSTTRALHVLLLQVLCLLLDICSMAAFSCSYSILPMLFALEPVQSRALVSRQLQALQLWCIFALNPKP